MHAHSVSGNESWRAENAAEQQFDNDSILLSSLRDSWLQLINLWPGLALWKSVYFLGHILVLGIMLVGAVFPPPRKSRRVAAAAADHLPGADAQKGEKKAS